MVLIDSYLNLSFSHHANIKNLGDSYDLKLSKKRSSKKIQSLFHPTSSSMGRTASLTREVLKENIAFRKTQPYFLEHRKIKKRNETNSDFEQKLIFKLQRLSNPSREKIAENVNFNDFKNLQYQGRNFDFQSVYKFWFISRRWVFDFLQNSRFETYNQTFIFNTSTNLWRLSEMKKEEAVNKIQGTRSLKKKCEFCFFKNFSKSELSYFDKNSMAFSKMETPVQENCLSLFFMEFFDHSQTIPSYLVLKTPIFFKLLLSNPLFLKTQHGLLQSFVFQAFQQYNSPSNGHSNTKNVPPSVQKTFHKPPTGTKSLFFLFKNLFYFYGYSSFQELFRKDLGGWLNPSRVNFVFRKCGSYAFKLWKHPHLQSLTFSGFVSNKEKKGRLDHKQLRDPFFAHLNLETDLLKISVDALTLSRLRKNFYSFQPLIQFTKWKYFILNQSSQNLSPLFSTILGLNLSFLNLKFEIEQKCMRIGSHPWNSWKSKTKKARMKHNGLICVSSLPVNISLLSLLDLQSSEDPKINIKKILKLNSWSSEGFLKSVPFRKLSEKKSLRGFWSYFYVNSDASIFVVSKHHFQSFQHIMRISNPWLLQSSTFLRGHRGQIMLPNNTSLFFYLDLTLKSKFKQEVICEHRDSELQVFKNPLVQQVQSIVKKAGSWSQYDLILKLIPYFYVYSLLFVKVWNKKTIASLDKEILNILWKWACARHNNKNKKWIRNKYFYKFKSNVWVFASSKKSVDLKQKVKGLLHHNDMFYLPRLSQIVFQLQLTKILN